MKNKESIISSLIYLVDFFCLLSFVDGNLFAFLSEYLSYIAFVVLSIIFALSKKRFARHSLVLVGIIALLLFVSIFKSVSGLGSYLNIIDIVLIMLIAGNISLSQKSQKGVMALSLISFATLFVKTITVWQDYINEAAILNPNVVAHFLTLHACILYISVTRFIKKKIAKNTIQVLLLLLTFMGVSMCNSRTAIIAILFMIIILRIGFIKNAILKFYRLTGIILVIIGTIIPFMYVKMYTEGKEFDIVFSTEKRFYSGREKIWKYSIEELDYNDGYIWGLGTHHETAIGEVSNFHNWYLGEIYYFGAVISIVLFLFVIDRLSYLESNEIKILALSIFIFGFFETSLQWEFSQMVFLPLLLFDEKDAEAKKRKKKAIFFKKKKGTGYE